MFVFLRLLTYLRFSDPDVGEFYEVPQDHLCICKPCSR